MRFLTIAGPGILPNDGFCPYRHVQLEEREGYQVCPLHAMPSRRTSNIGQSGGRNDARTAHHRASIPSG